MENIVLEKINFVNGSAGKTPLNSNNMNAIQQNTENAINEVVPIITGIEENTENNNSDIAEAKINIANNTNNILEINKFIENSMKTLSAEGTSIHVADSADYGCKLEIEGKSEQVQTEQGKNLLPINIYEFESNVSKSYTQKIFLKKDVSYKFSYKTEGTNIRTFVKNEGGITIAGSIYSGATINVENDGVYTFASDRSTTEVVKAGRVYDIQLEEGTVATEFEPFTPDSPSPNYPSPIENVSGDLLVKVIAKNILPRTFAEDLLKRLNISSTDDYLLEIDGKNYFKFQAGLGYQTGKNYFIQDEFEENAQYVFKAMVMKASSETNGAINIGYVYTDGTMKSFNVGTWTNMTEKEVMLTSDAGKTIKRIRLFYNEGTTYINLDKYILCKLEAGIDTSKLEYEPYKEQKVTFPLGEQKLMKDGYLGESGIINKRKQVVLDGTESWQQVEFSSGGYYYTYTPNNLGQLTENNNILCNYFKPKNTWSEKKEGIWFDSNIIVTTTESLNENESLSEFKAWLAEQYANSTPVVIEYETQEEETTAYTTEQQMAYNELQKLKTYRTVTNVSNSQDTNMVLTYKKDLQTQFQEIETMLLESGV